MKNTWRFNFKRTITSKVAWMVLFLLQSGLFAQSAPNFLIGVNSGGKLYRKNVTVTDASAAWEQITNVPGGANNAKHVTAGDDGSIWLLTKDGKLYRQKADGSWQEKTERPGDGILQMDAGLNQLVAVTNSNGIYYLKDISTGNPLGSSWVQIDGSLKNISVNGNGKIWGVNRNAQENIYYQNNVGPSAWQHPGGSLVQICVGGNDDNAWGVNINNDMYSWNGSSWNYLTGSTGFKSTYVAKTTNDYVFALGTNSVGGGFGIFRYQNNKWTEIGGGLVQLDVGVTPLEILFASYGNHSVVSSATQRKTVTETAQSKIQNNQLAIPARGYNGLFGDPQGGLQKSMFFVYKVGSNLYANISDEYSAVTIPNAADQAIYSIGQSTTGFQLLKAFYGDARGAQGRFTDVTTKLQTKIQGNTIVMAPATGTATFNVDPAPGIGKGIIAIFRDGADLYFQVITEPQGGTISAANAIKFYTDAAVKPNIIINHAWYGIDGVDNNATAQTVINKLNDTIKRYGFIAIPANMNKFYGIDPFPGKVKTTAIALTLNGVRVSPDLRAPENKDFVYPKEFEGTEAATRALKGEDPIIAPQQPVAAPTADVGTGLKYNTVIRISPSADGNRNFWTHKDYHNTTDVKQVGAHELIIGPSSDSRQTNGAHLYVLRKKDDLASTDSVKIGDTVEILSFASSGGDYKVSPYTPDPRMLTAVLPPNSRWKKQNGDIRFGDIAILALDVNNNSRFFTIGSPSGATGTIAEGNDIYFAQDKFQAWVYGGNRWGNAYWEVLLTDPAVDGRVNEGRKLKLYGVQPNSAYQSTLDSANAWIQKAIPQAIRDQAVTDTLRTVADNAAAEKTAADKAAADKATAEKTAQATADTERGTKEGTEAGIADARMVPPMGQRMAKLSGSQEYINAYQAAYPKAYDAEFVQVKEEAAQMAGSNMFKFSPLYFAANKITFHENWQIQEADNGHGRISVESNGDVVIAFGPQADSQYYKITINKEQTKFEVGGNVVQTITKAQNKNAALESFEGGLNMTRGGAAQETSQQLAFGTFWFRIDKSDFTFGSGYEIGKNVIVKHKDATPLKSLKFVGFGGTTEFAQFNNIEVGEAEQPLNIPVEFAERGEGADLIGIGSTKDGRILAYMVGEEDDELYKFNTGGMEENPWTKVVAKDVYGNIINEVKNPWGTVNRGFDDISVTSDGNVFVVTGGNLYYYDEPKDLWVYIPAPDLERPGRSLKFDRVSAGNQASVFVITQDWDETKTNNLYQYVDNKFVRLGVSAQDISAGLDKVFVINKATTNEKGESIGGDEVFEFINGKFEKVFYTDDKGVRHQLKLSQISYGGNGYAMGIYEKPNTNISEIWSFNKDKNNWEIVKGEDGKDAVGFTTISINAAGTAMGTDEDGNIFMRGSKGVETTKPAPTAPAVQAPQPAPEAVAGQPAPQPILATLPPLGALQLLTATTAMPLVEVKEAAPSAQEETAQKTAKEKRKKKGKQQLKQEKSEKRKAKGKKLKAKQEEFKTAETKTVTDKKGKKKKVKVSKEGKELKQPGVKKVKGKKKTKTKVEKVTKEKKKKEKTTKDKKAAAPKGKAKGKKKPVGPGAVQGAQTKAEKKAARQATKAAQPTARRQAKRAAAR